jgi:hypothetical protein
LYFDNLPQFKSSKDEFVGIEIVIQPLQCPTSFLRMHI